MKRARKLARRRVGRGLASIAALALQLACAARNPAASDAEALASLPARRVLLAPMNALAKQLFHQLEPGAQRVYTELCLQLERSRTAILRLRPGELERIAAEIPADENALFVDRSRLDPRAILRLFEQHCADRPCDALFVPEIALISVPLEGSGGRWGGVKRRMKGLAGGTWSGSIQAASLRLRAFSPDALMLFEEFGGLDWIFEPKIGERRFVPAKDPLSNLAHLREGVAIALRPWIEVKSR